MNRAFKNNNPGGENIAPSTSRFSVNNMDQTADPFTDFYRYANGKWLDSNPVPADKTKILDKENLVKGRSEKYLMVSESFNDLSRRSRAAKVEKIRNGHELMHRGSVGEALR